MGCIRHDHFKFSVTEDLRGFFGSVNSLVVIAYTEHTDRISELWYGLIHVHIMSKTPDVSTNIELLFSGELANAHLFKLQNFFIQNNKNKKKI